MSTALDVYAMTNPALGSALIWSFLHGASRHNQGVEFPLLFLPMPILLSSDLASTFEGTSSRTGLFGWLDRHPYVTVGLAERIRLTRAISRRAILFASQTRIVTADNNGAFRSTGVLTETKLRRAEATVRPLFPVAKRFGAWIGEVGSTRAVMYALGIAP